MTTLQLQIKQLYFTKARYQKSSKAQKDAEHTSAY